MGLLEFTNTYVPVFGVEVGAMVMVEPPLKLAEPDGLTTISSLVAPTRSNRISPPLTVRLPTVSVPTLPSALLAPGWILLPPCMTTLSTLPLPASVALLLARLIMPFTAPLATSVCTPLAPMLNPPPPLKLVTSSVPAEPTLIDLLFPIEPVERIASVPPLTVVTPV